MLVHKYFFKLKYSYFSDKEKGRGKGKRRTKNRMLHLHMRRQRQQAMIKKTYQKRSEKSIAFCGKMMDMLVTIVQCSDFETSCVIHMKLLDLVKSWEHLLLIFSI